MVIPICRKEKINNKGGTAPLWQIEVPEEFVGPRLRDVIPSARFFDLNDNGGWVCRSISDPYTLEMKLFLLTFLLKIVAK
jgi:hypothetical protein